MDTERGGGKKNGRGQRKGEQVKERDKRKGEHRRRSSVNCRGQDIFGRKIFLKIKKMPEFYIILA